MTIAKGFTIIIPSGFAFALGGGLSGYGLALLEPGYYRGVFSSGREPRFDPVAVGLGLGVTQGLICGLLVGAVVVLAVAWYRSRRGAFEDALAPRAGLPQRRQAEGRREEAGITSRPGDS
jgi:hypothetical protein